MNEQSCTWDKLFTARRSKQPFTLSLCRIHPQGLPTRSTIATPQTVLRDGQRRLHGCSRTIKAPPTSISDLPFLPTLFRASSSLYPTAMVSCCLPCQTARVEGSTAIHSPARIIPLDMGSHIEEHRVGQEAVAANLSGQKHRAL